MDFNKIRQLYNTAWDSIEEYDKLVNVNREKADKYLNKGLKCVDEADEILGIISTTR
jgi:hypothetical protein